MNNIYILKREWECPECKSHEVYEKQASWACTNCHSKNVYCKNAYLQPVTLNLEDEKVIRSCVLDEYPYQPFIS